MTLEEALTTLAVEFEGVRLLDSGLLRYTRRDSCGSWWDALMDADDVRELIEALTVVLAEMEGGR